MEYREILDGQYRVPKIYKILLMKWDKSFMMNQIFFKWRLNDRRVTFNVNSKKVFPFSLNLLLGNIYMFGSRYKYIFD